MHVVNPEQHSLAAHFQPGSQVLTFSVIGTQPRVAHHHTPISAGPSQTVGVHIGYGLQIPRKLQRQRERLPIRSTWSFLNRESLLESDRSVFVTTPCNTPPRPRPTP